MPRKFFRNYLPTHDTVLRNRWIGQFGDLLKHPNLWHLNRRSVSGGFAAGLFAGLIPGPLQMIGGTLLATFGYFTVDLGWRCYTVTTWCARQRRHAKGAPTP